MENKKDKKDIALLPNRFKIIGIVIMILAFVPAIIIKSMNIKLIQSHKELFKVMTLNVFILGLFFIAISKDKIEDEMTFIIRLKSMALTFSFTVLSVIIKPIVDLLFKNPPSDLTGQQIVMNMLFVYMIIYYVQKRGR